MNWLKFCKFFAAVAGLALLFGCASPTPPTPFDYSAYRQSAPRSILVLPPINNTPDVQASNSVLSQLTYPLAEAGYYVLPVTLVEQTFRENGMTQATDMQSTPIDKLHQIFGADAALYISVDKYGTVYKIIDSVTEVSLSAKLIDLRNGAELWYGTAGASSQEDQQQQQGLLGALVSAVVNQIVASTFDKSHKLAGVAANRLLWAGGLNGNILPGPRSPRYTSHDAQ